MFETDKPIRVETARRQAIFGAPKCMILLDRLASSIEAIIGSTEITFAQRTASASSLIFDRQWINIEPGC
jgi:hypothetical protein